MAPQGGLPLQAFGNERVNRRVEFRLRNVVMDNSIGDILQSLRCGLGFALFFRAEVFERFFAIATVLGAADDAVIARLQVGVYVEEAEILIGRYALEVGWAAGPVDDDDPAVGSVDSLLGYGGEDILPVRLAQHARKLLHVGTGNLHLEGFENFSERIGKKENLGSVTALQIGGGGSFSCADGTGETDDETRAHVRAGFEKYRRSIRISQCAANGKRPDEIMQRVEFRANSFKVNQIMQIHEQLLLSNPLTLRSCGNRFFRIRNGAYRRIRGLFRA